MRPPFRVLTRAFHTTRTARGGASPPWGSEVNEPGGRLFGEPIRKPGERRKMYDWEVTFLGTLALAGVILGVGLNSRPNTSPQEWAKQQAKERLEAAYPGEKFD